MTCTKQFFTTLNPTHIRFNKITGLWDGVNSFTFSHAYPFVPLAWMRGGNGVPSDLGISATAAQNTYRFVLEGFIPYLALAGSTFPNPTGFLTLCNNTYGYEKYMERYLGQLDSSGTDWEGNVGPITPNSLYFKNINAHRMPGAMVSQFWTDENTTPDPDTLISRLYKLSNDILSLTDPRLWCPPGLYTIEDSFTGVDIGATLGGAYLDPAIGNNNGDGVSIMIMEIKSIE
jgi:hypothetical protein